MDTNMPKLLDQFCTHALRAIIGAVDGERMMRDVGDIVATDRWNSFDRWHETTQTLRRAYEQAGAAVEVDAIQTGGRLNDGHWRMHEAFDVRGGTIDIVTPQPRRVADYLRNPWHVAQWSASTPGDGVTGTLTVCDDQAKLRKLPAFGLRNKVLLTRASLRELLPTLARLQPLAVISDRALPGATDGVAWEKLGWGGIPISQGPVRLVAMVLSARQGGELRTQVLRDRDMTVRVCVDIHRYVGTHDVVSGIVHGSDDPGNEIWALAHSAEPGALDNASGVATCIEIARVLEQLIAAGILPRPKRSIRLLNAYECYGFFAYMEQRRRFETPLAGVNIDTVGALPRVSDGKLQWHATVPGSAGFVDRVGLTMLQATLPHLNPGYTLSYEPFYSTSDTLVGDPKYGFPCPWLTTLQGLPRIFNEYHSSADVQSIVSPEGLALSAASMAGYLYYLADMGTAGAVELAADVAEQTATELRACGTDSPGNAASRVEAMAVNVARLQRWLWGGDRKAAMRAMGRASSSVKKAAGRVSASRRRTGGTGRVPRRKALLAPTLENTPAHIADRLRESRLEQWALYWADGQRDVATIADRLTTEYGRVISVAQVQMYFEALAELGYVDLVEPRDMLTTRRLMDDLKQLGVAPGMDVIVHSSLAAVGHVIGGADAIVETLVRVVGREGTLLMPSFNHRGASLYNPQATPTANGAIPDAMWRRQDAVRSMHPTHPVAAIGKRAVEYCDGHIEAGIWGPNSPIGRLVHGNGYILALGVTHNTSTAYHVAELNVPCGCIDQRGNRDRVLMPDGSIEIVPGLAFRESDCPVEPVLLDDALDRAGVQRRGNVGNAACMLVKARDLYEIRKAHLSGVCPACPIKPRYARKG
jgi:aminoglycoside 3-N-acetyltransferase